MVHSKKDAKKTATTKPMAAQKKNELTCKWGVGGRVSTQSIGDPRFGQVVGGHFDADAVTDGEADKVAAHFAGDVGEDFVLVVQDDAKHRAWQNRLNGSFQFNGLFTAHTVLRYNWTMPDSRVSENSTEESPAWDLAIN